MVALTQLTILCGEPTTGPELLREDIGYRGSTPSPVSNTGSFNASVLQRGKPRGGNIT